jgi:DNA-directed RNA polymerase alpha subunit
MKIHAEFHSVAEMASFARLVQSGLVANPNAKFKEKDEPAVEKDWQRMYERTEANLQRALHRLSLADPEGKTANYDAGPPAPAANTGTPIEELEFTVRTENCCRAENILTVEDLCAWRAKELLKIPNLGAKSLKEIRETLAARGLTLWRDE